MLECEVPVVPRQVRNVYGFMGTLYDRFDVVLLSKLAGDYATGIYSVAYRALGSPGAFSAESGDSEVLRDAAVERSRLQGLVRLAHRLRSVQVVLALG